MNPDAPKHVEIDRFRTIFKTHPHLQDVQISNMKRNFGKCPICRLRRYPATTSVVAVISGGSLCGRRGEKGIASAIRKGDADEYVRRKADRMLHLIHCRMEKLNYYFEREMARSPVAVKMTLIIDKMDQSKNMACPLQGLTRTPTCA